MKTVHSALTTFCIASALCLAAATAHAQQLVVNGGFESGAFAPGWTLTDTDPMPLSNVGNNPLFAHSGIFHANLGVATGFPPASLSQTLSTTPGGTFTLSLWLAHDVTTAPSNQFQIFFDNVPILTLTNVGAFSYTNFTFPNLVASGSSTPLVFRFTDNDDFFRLDDVSVVPEPGVTALLALAGLLLLCSRLRTKKSSLS